MFVYGEKHLWLLLQTQVFFFHSWVSITLEIANSNIIDFWRFFKNLIWNNF